MHHVGNRDVVSLRSTVMVLLTSCVLMGVVGAIDYVTGPEISFSIFYLLPVSLAAWRAGLPWGCLMALASAGIWMAVDIVTGHTYSHVTIPWWNAGVRLGFFLIVTVALHLKQKTDEILRQAQARFSALFEFAPEPIVVVDQAGRIVQANAQAAQAFGYRPAELLGMSVESLLPPRFRTLQLGESSYIGYSNAGQRRVSQELCGLRKDNSEFPLEVISSPMEATGRRETMVVLRDGSPRRVMETQLRQYREGQVHSQCEAQVTKLKMEVNAALQEIGKPKRYE